MAIRIWTDQNHRKKGHSKELLKCAIRYYLIFSDEEGLTEESYNLLNNKNGCDIIYFDLKLNTVVDLSAIHPEDLFTYYTKGKRWQMILKSNA